MWIFFSYCLDTSIQQQQQSSDENQPKTSQTMQQNETNTRKSNLTLCGY